MTASFISTYFVLVTTPTKGPWERYPGEKENIPHPVDMYKHYAQQTGTQTHLVVAISQSTSDLNRILYLKNVVKMHF